MTTFLLLISLLAFQAPVEDQQPAPVLKLAGIKCIVSGKQTTAKYHADYKRGKVYFDCNASRVAFRTGKNQFRTKANHQLVVTGQYVQTKCPISKNRLTVEAPASVSIAGVKIRFSSNEFKMAFVETYQSEQQIEALFANTNFHSFFGPRPKVTKQTTDKSVR